MAVTYRNRDLWAISAGAFSVLLALIVLYGWYTHNKTLIQIHPSFAPMQYNTALGFLLCGLGLTFLAIRYNYAAQIFGATAAFIGLLTIYQYITGLNLGLDELFMKHNITNQTSHPGRMAPNTAFCFSLVGIALISGGTFHSYINRDQIVRMLGGTAFVMGAAAFLGYVGNIETAYGWAHLTRMAEHTSFGFIVLGVGLIANSWFERGLRLDNSSPYWLAGAATCFTLIVAFNISSQIHGNEKKAIQQSVKAETSYLVDKIRAALATHMRSLNRMKNRWEVSEGLSEKEWRSDARSYISDHDGLMLIAHVNKNMDVNWQENQSNFKLTGNIVFNDKERAVLEEASKTSREFTIALSSHEGDAENVMMAIFPIDYNWKNDGFIIAQFDIQKKLAAMIPIGLLDSYGVSIGIGGKTFYRSEKKFTHIQSHKKTIDFHGTQWVLETWPKKTILETANSGLALTLAIGGAIISILISIVTIYGVKAVLIARSLRESEGRTQTILDNTVEGIITIDKVGTIETYNAACIKIFGYEPEEVIGQNVKMLMPTPYAEAHDGYLENFSRTGKRKIIGIGREVEGLTKQGRIFPLDLSVGEVNYGNRKGYAGVVRDISERKKFEADQGRLIDKLAKSNSELDDFAYIASHDMKEPLRAIHNHSCFLLEDYQDKLDNNGVKKLNRLIALSKRMEKLTNDLLYFSRLGREDLAYKNTDLNEVIADINHTMLDTFSERNAMLDVKGVLPVVKCDAVRVTELFKNLIANGIKYNKNENKQIEIGYNEIDHTLYVKDNGIGIDEEFHNDVFRIFKRLNSEKTFGEGSGAGLTFVKKIVENHGGRIWIESEPGSGTTFYFTLKGKAA